MSRNALSQPLRVALLLFSLVLFLGVAAAGYLALAQEPYTIYVDGEMKQVSGSYESVEAVLAAAEVELRPEDRVSPPLSATPSAETAIQVARAQRVTLRSDEGAETLWTHQPTLGALFAEQQIGAGPTDQIYADAALVPFHALDETPLPEVVELGRFMTVSIHNGHDVRRLRTAAETVGGALQEAGIVLYASDGVEPPAGSWLEPEMQIRVRRSVPLSIQVDGRTIQTRSHHTAPLKVVTEAGIGLVGQDFLRPGPGTELSAGDTIQVVRVTEDYLTVDEAIPYETLWQATEQLEIDERGLLQAGQPGIYRQRIRIRYENGAPVAETPAGAWVAREPSDEIIGYGTKIIVRVLETPDGVFEYWRRVRMRVTSYTAASAGKPPDHPAYGITASGVRAGTGVVAIDPRVVPFRSWVYVPGYGPGFAGDTGGGVKGRWIDLGFDEGEYESWRGYVDVYYLTPVPPPEDINYLIPRALP
ncbi:MAG: ubiquitin-like domain-containing protein [Candidatus Promineifilaceae bacterium]|nr:ubiquitin-like domain-containing protein [Candidatus Promineifilaceae bacterium]